MRNRIGLKKTDHSAHIWSIGNLQTLNVIKVVAMHEPIEVTNLSTMGSSFQIGLVDVYCPVKSSGSMYVDLERQWNIQDGLYIRQETTTY